MRTRARFLIWFAPILLASSLFCVSDRAVAADSLAGTWQHQRDSGGWKVLQGGVATIRLEKNGKATLTATAANQNPLEVSGTWSEQGGRVTIKIPDQFEFSNQPYRLQGDALTLPAQLSDDKPGTSTWIRVQSQGIDLVFAVFRRAVEDGKGAATAAEEAAKEARKQEGVEKVEVLKEGTGLEITLAPTPGAGKSRGYAWFATKPAPLTPPVQRKAMSSPLAGDPRTHIDAKNPAGDPDAPAARTALIVAPFHSRSYYAFTKAVWKEGPGGKPQVSMQYGKTSTFKELGDDPYWLAEELRKADYNVKLLVDDQATPGPIFRALQTKPSIIYFSTHGGVAGTEDGGNAIASAGELGAKYKDVKNPVTVGERLRDLLNAEGLPEAARAGITWGVMDSSNGFVFRAPLLLPKFFEEALGKQGVPGSLVYVDACYSAAYSDLARAFKAKAYLGHVATVAGWASARFARYIFSNMLHRGHSVREAWDRLVNLCNGAYVVYLEDSILSPVARGDVDLKEEAANMVAWGIGQKPHSRINNEVFWLMRMARWANKDVNDGADTLARCYAQYWRPPSKRPGLADQYCNSGILGSHTPVAEEVEDARHLVSGRPSKPIGRFVLR